MQHAAASTGDNYNTIHRTESQHHIQASCAAPLTGGTDPCPERMRLSSSGKVQSSDTGRRNGSCPVRWTKTKSTVEAKVRSEPQTEHTTHNQVKMVFGWLSTQVASKEENCPQPRIIAKRKENVEHRNATYRNKILHNIHMRKRSNHYWLGILGINFPT